MRAPSLKAFTFVAIVALCSALLLPAAAFAEGVLQPAQAGDLTAQGDAIASGESGTCTWVIDSEGALIVRPTTGGVGRLGSWEDAYDGAPWYRYGSVIKSARFEGEVEAQTCQSLFYNCYNLTSLNLSGLDTSNVTDMRFMFDNCSSLSSLDLSPLDTSNVTDTEDMFLDCRSLPSLDLSPLNTSKVTGMHGMFQGCTSLSSLDLSGFDTSNVTDMHQMFDGCSSLKSLDLSNLDTSKVTSMSYMFHGCRSLPSLDLSPLDTSAVKNMEAMFAGCSSLKSLDLSMLDTSNVTAICDPVVAGMFQGCTSLESLDLSGLDTSRVEDMDYMFKGCTSLKSLDLSGFDTSRVWRMDSMLSGCSSLETVLAGVGWSTENVWVSEKMFENCTSIVGGNGTKYDAAHIDKEYACVDAEGAPGYLTAAPSKEDIAGAAVTLSQSSYIYDGAAKEPAVTVALGGKALAAGTDYTVEYADNVNAGTATVTVSGKGGYTGEVTAAFGIAKAKVDAPAAAAGLVYGGSELTGVAPGAGYSVEGGSATDAGAYEATARLVDPANREWADGAAADRKVAWSIAPAPIGEAQVSTAEATYARTGEPIEPVVTVTLDGRELVKGRDYTVAYRDNVNVGAAIVTVIGKSNYTGQAEATFEIAKSDLASYAGAAASSGMSDLVAGEWYMDPVTGAFSGTGTFYIDYTIARGLMSGYKDESGKVTAFGTHDPLKRAQTATILYRLANPESLATTDPAHYEANSSGLPDVADGQYYTAAVNWCVANGVITGYTDKSGKPTGFGPGDDVTREQLATMICRYCTAYAGQPEASAAISSFSDYARISDWARTGVAFCVANGIVGGYTDGSGRFGPGDKAERCQMAKIIAVTARMLE